MGPQKEPVVLNSFKKDSLNRSATSVAETLVNCWHGIAQKNKYWITYPTHIDFDYSKLRGNSVCVFFEHYKKAVGDLQSVSVELLLTQEEKTAFFINVYNCLLLHIALILQGIPTSLDTWKRVAAKAYYNIDGKLFSLTDIEKVLKVQAPTSKLFGFGSDVSGFELRFLLVTATKQSPTMTVVKSTTLQEQIKLAAQCYIQSYLSMSSKPNGELVIIVPELLAPVCKVLQKGLRNQSNTISALVFQSLNGEQQQAVQQAKKIVCTSNPFFVMQTDFSCIVKEQKDLKGVFDAEFIQALVSDD